MSVGLRDWPNFEPLFGVGMVIKSHTPLIRWYSRSRPIPSSFSRYARHIGIKRDIFISRIAKSANLSKALDFIVSIFLVSERVIESRKELTIYEIIYQNMNQNANMDTKQMKE